MFKEKGLDMYSRLLFDFLKSIKETVKHEMDLFIEQVTIQETKTDKDTFDEVHDFFQANKKDVGFDAYGLKKTELPEDADITLLMNVVLLDDTYLHRFIVSADKHFSEYSSEILKEYSIHIVDVRELDTYCIGWVAVLSTKHGH